MSGALSVRTSSNDQGPVGQAATDGWWQVPSKDLGLGVLLLGRRGMGNLVAKGRKTGADVWSRWDVGGVSATGLAPLCCKQLRTIPLAAAQHTALKGRDVREPRNTLT